MDPQKFRRMAELFEAASSRPVGERAAYLKAACGADDELRGRVQSLLMHYESAADPLQSDWLERAAVAQPRLRDDLKPLLRETKPGSSAGAGLDPRETLNFRQSGMPARFVEESAGTRIDRYELLERIGEGGFGTVYRARQLAPLVREVALKIVKPGMDTRQVIARFEAERQTLALMDHPGIAQVYDAGATPAGRPYFVMELVRGAAITQYANERRLPLRRRLELFVQVCQAVQHAHQKGVIHRDIKPSNVLVVEHEGRAGPKVIDFGIAKAARQRATADSLVTMEGFFIGTPAYMSPEQADLRGEDVDTRSDVYSLGMLLYELLTGATPWAGEEFTRPGRAGLAELLRTIREVEPRPPSRFVPSLRGDLDAIVMKCLEKDRTRRYASAIALAEDVERFLRDEPVEAAPPSRVYRLKKMVRRNRALVAAGAAIVVLLIAAVVGTTVGLIEARAQRRLAVAGQGEAERQRDLAEAVTMFVTADLLGGDDPNRRPEERDARISDVVLRAQKRIDDGALEKKPAAEAAVRLQLGQLAMSFGRYDDAEKNMRRALELGKASPSPVDPQLYGSMGNLATILHMKGNFPGSAALFREALDAMQKDGRYVQEEIYSTLCNNYAELLRATGDLDGAERMYRLALSVRPKKPVLAGQRGRVLSNLGELQRQRGDFAGAIVTADEALASLRAAYGEEHASIATVMNNKALALRARKEQGEAETLLRASLAMRKKLLPATHESVAQSLNNLASLLRDTGRAEEAEPLYREALGIAEKSLPAGHFQIGLIHRNIGNCLIRLGRFPEAEGEIQSAYDMLKQTRGLPPAHLEQTRAAFVGLYEAWDKADPEAGAGEKAERWRNGGGAE